MNPAGSIRRTIASRAVSPPHCSTVARVPALTRTASVDSRSVTIFHLPWIANLDERFAGGDDAFAFTQALEYDAVDRRPDRNRCARASRCGTLQPGTCAFDLGRGGAHSERGRVDRFLCQRHVGLARFEVLCRSDARPRP